MEITLKEEEIQKLIEKTVEARVHSIVDKKLNDSLLLNEQNLKRMIQESIDERIYQTADSEYREAIKTFDKKTMCESLATKICDYLFEY